MRGAIVLLSLLAGGVASAATLHRPILGISAEERYDDDALHGAGDLWTKVSPLVGYEMKGETRKLDATYAVDVIHMLRRSDFGVDHRGALEYTDRLTDRLTLHLRGGLFRVQDASSLPRLGVARVRAGVLWARTDGELRYRITARTEGELGYAGDLTKLLRAEYPLGVVHAPFAAVMHRLTPRLSVGARYRFQLFTADWGRTADAHTGVGLLRYRITRHTTLALEAGPVLFRGDSAPFVAPRVHGELAYYARGVELAINGGRDFVGAAGYATAIWADYVQAVAGWRVAAPVSMYAAGGLFRNGRAPNQPVDAQGYGLSAGVEWRFARGASLQLGYDRIAQVDFGGVGLNLSRNIFAVRVGYRTP